MDTQAAFDAWTAGKSYEHYMGRWSRIVAAEFLDWLKAPVEADWLELGCGTGALTSAILQTCAPRSILASDVSADFVDHASHSIRDPRASFVTADAQRLPAEDGSVDVVTSGLVLNFVPDRPTALAEMRRVLRPDGFLSFYVWDYPGGGIGFIDEFWKAATQLDSKAAELDESARFPFCTKPGLAALCEEAGIQEPEIEAIEILTEFPDFESFWHPFTLGAGPAPGYCKSLAEEHRLELRSLLAQRLDANGTVKLKARAWAVRARLSN